MAAHVLVIEDDPELRPVMEQLLTEAGFRVTAAATGRDGLKQFDAHQPDLVLLDLVLPELDGLEVCRQIRTRSDVPVIMLTAMTTEPVTVAGLHAGADDYVRKPFNSDDLIARIQTALRKKQVTEREAAAPPPLRGGATAGTGPNDWQSGPTGRTVLLVGDDARAREQLARALRTAGFEPIEAADSPEALDVLGWCRPAVILLDLALPGADGIRFAEELRRRRLRPGVPIIVLSPAEGARQQTALIGAEACLIKPFRMPELLAEVNRVAAGSR